MSPPCRTCQDLALRRMAYVLADHLREAHKINAPRDVAHSMVFGNRRQKD